MSPPERSRALVNRVAAHIRAQAPRGRLSLEQLARVAGTSPSYLSRAFRAAMGVTPHQYVIRVRLLHATRLLRSGRGLADVARLTGFANKSHLSRTLRRVLGRGAASLQPKRRTSPAPGRGVARN